MILTNRSLTVDGAPLDHPSGAWFVEGGGATVIGSAAAVHVTRQTLPRRHGVLSLPNARYGMGRAVVSVIVTDIDPDTGERGGFPVAWANRARVQSMFGIRWRPIVLGMTPAPGVAAQVARGEVVAEVPAVEISPTHWRLKFTVDMLDAFWRDEHAQTVDYAARVCLRGGSAPMQDPLILAPGQGDNTVVRVVDLPSGAWVEFRGDVPADEWVRLEPADETAFISPPGQWNGGDEYARGLTVSPGGFALSPEAEWHAPAGTWVQVRRAFL